MKLHLSQLCGATTDMYRAGNFLYKKFGFYDFEQITHNGEVKGTAMKRDPRSDHIRGGKS